MAVVGIDSLRELILKVKAGLGNKVDKVANKGLSTNDFTTALKDKLDGISTNAKKVEASSTNGKIKIDGTETTVYSHPTSGATAGTYRSVTVTAQGHVTGGTNPTTLSGYGITDAKIASGTITLGSNSITPLTSSSSLDASKLTGTIDLARIPKGAKEICKVVANDTARFALTTDDVQNGDTVKVTGTKKMYYVIDDTKLSQEAGYTEYLASTDWSVIANKPSSYTPAAHTHTMAQISDLTELTAAQVDTLWADPTAEI